MDSNTRVATSIALGLILGIAFGMINRRSKDQDENFRQD
jgi:hypothetical protein